ncbi:calcium-translocating P-type ATPase, PMCA-type [Natranaerobius thermophilus]|uniref:P-type Ca(2+) transporter n=1 Tax=Natranaerobius thermophilus (strain ATCC BAA-1301 / DSM 18059 / JW/NM-WN-LF) TaxID=457570 RepID=B2A2J4_NATTJ|nr:calcium-translocating P-type ATPase, PMCA-type [Natranaerobius thermophilus]ACB84909.1 ATPase, P-type (transporting), HAD superfamily, subfamily IC [Natranaerobius thermophilus JW/NM-WN-LF]
MSFYFVSTKDVAKELNTNIEQGLTTNEAHKRQGQYGDNVLPTDKGVKWWDVLIDQFRDFMVLVLLVATLISGLLGEYTDAVTIIAIVFLNAILGFYQEYKAEQSLDALKQLTAPKSWVIRDNQYQEVYALDLVPGDVVFIDTGSRVPADLRLIEEQGLEITEAELTGESVPVKKHTDTLNFYPDSTGDISNMAFMGTMVSKGTAKGVVTGTGQDTEMGQIAYMLSEKDDAEETPLQKRLAYLGKILVTVCLVVCLLVAILGIFRGEPVYKMFMAGVSLAVAAIPEGLPAVVTIALAVGVQRMMKRKALVRKLPAVETLGSATVICADKTGTLTTNEMKVDEIYAPDEPEALKMCHKIAILCNHSVYEEGRGIVRGEPTEKALMAKALDEGYSPDQLLTYYSFLDELQFDSDRKRMSVFYQIDGKGWESQESILLVTKGAPEMILPRCTQIHGDKAPQKLTESKSQEIFKENENMANNALRNIAMGYKYITREQYERYKHNLADLESQLTFVGIIGLLDPPREKVKYSITRCLRAGVKTKMITGDHKATAVAIAKKINLLNEENGKVMEGKELDNISDDKLAQIIDRIKVFARVSPKHKLRIVTALKRQGNIVAMTGDGINDAPAIKSADIGISMGVTGTDVTKGAAELILADDNFATIESAIEEGRGIYDNIKKFIKFLLACNFGEILTMFFAMLIGLPLPLKPIQILWVNLVTDGFPAIALGVAPKEDDLMQRKPKSPQESIFSGGLFESIVGRGFLISLVSVFAFMRGLEFTPHSIDFARTMAFSTLVVSQLLFVFECQNLKGGFTLSKIFKTPQVMGAVLLSFALFCAVIYLEPLATIFDTYRLSWEHWSVIFVLSLIPTIISYLLKQIPRILTIK